MIAIVCPYSNGACYFSNKLCVPKTLNQTLLQSWENAPKVPRLKSHYMDFGNALKFFT